MEAFRFFSLDVILSGGGNFDQVSQKFAQFSYNLQSFNTLEKYDKLVISILKVYNSDHIFLINFALF